MHTARKRGSQIWRDRRDPCGDTGSYRKAGKHRSSTALAGQITEKGRVPKAARACRRYYSARSGRAARCGLVRSGLASARSGLQSEEVGIDDVFLIYRNRAEGRSVPGRELPLSADAVEDLMNDDTTDDVPPRGARARQAQDTSGGLVDFVFFSTLRFSAPSCPAASPPLLLPSCPITPAP